MYLPLYVFRFCFYSLEYTLSECLFTLLIGIYQASRTQPGAQLVLANIGQQTVPCPNVAPLDGLGTESCYAEMMQYCD